MEKVITSSGSKSDLGSTKLNALGIRQYTQG